MASMISSCQAGSTADTVICMCGAGFYGDGFTCTPCLACNLNAIMKRECLPGSISDTVACGCNAGYYGNGITCTLCRKCHPFAIAVNECVGNATIDETGCKCNTGYFGDGFSCDLCKCDELDDEMLSSCYSDGQINSTACWCPSGHYSYNGTCEPCWCDTNEEMVLNCSSGSTSNTPKCQCKEGFFTDMGACSPCTCQGENMEIVTDCKAGSKTNSPICTCKEGYQWDPVYGECSISCPDHNSVANNASVPYSGCSCNVGYFGDGLSCFPCRLCDSNAVYLTKCQEGSTLDTVTCRCREGFHGDGYLCEQVSKLMCTSTQIWMSKNCLFNLSEFKQQESNDFCVAPSISCNTLQVVSTIMIEAALEVASAKFVPTTTSAVEFLEAMMFAVQGLNLSSPLLDDVPFFANPGLVFWANAGTVFPSGLTMQVCYVLCQK
jgi:hypothetical protein